MSARPNSECRDIFRLKHGINWKYTYFFVYIFFIWTRSQHMFFNVSSILPFVWRSEKMCRCEQIVVSLIIVGVLKFMRNGIVTLKNAQKSTHWRFYPKV